ncbi:vacuolar protein sorting-associated protein 54 isoform X2 [Sipha flava]|uniref:Vacuolar protein sorting-associated protein 54 n=1 Tax=Sipha flava TaxID=143950 RepID=A0A8B8FNF1_9HEMI|nr:vacuolar protein sorting-associated protein 54 isoform X2 [Sipha flava]
MDRAVTREPIWHKCSICHNATFEKLDQFQQHLFEVHSRKKDSQYFCEYNSNGNCFMWNGKNSNESDYKKHIVHDHAFRSIPCLTTYRKTSDSKRPTNEWNFYSASQSLATVLNDPRRPRSKDFFTKIWGDKFTDTCPISPPQHLPVIRPQHFQTYLKRIAKRHKKHVELEEKRDKQDYPAEVLQQFPNLRLSKSTDKVIYDLSEVPSIFLEPHFDLSKHETFFAVFPNIFLTSDTSTHVNVSTANIRISDKSIQEKLSHYLDTVEVKIAQQVSSKSEAFFHTMTSHDTLMEQIRQSIQLTKDLRCRIRQVDEKVVSKSMTILKNNTIILNHSNVIDKLKLMATVYHTQTTIQVLLSAADYVAALDLIYTTKDLLSKELSGVHCFRHLTSELNEIIKMIDALMAGEFERCSSADLNRPLVGTCTEVLEKDKLYSILMGMLRRKNWAFLEAYNKECVAAISAAIKKSVIDIVSNSDVDHQVNQSSSLESYLHCLTANEWLSMLEDCSYTLSLLLRRIKAGYIIMLHALNVSAKKLNCHNENTIDLEEPSFDSNLSEEDYFKVKSKLTNLLNSVTKYAVEKYAQLVTKRSSANFLNNAESEQVNGNTEQFNGDEESSNYCLSDQNQLLRLSDCIKQLSDSYVEVCSNQDIGFKILQTAMQSEANNFIKKFHTEKINKLQLLLDSENWRQKVVPSEFQHLVEYIQNTGQFSMPKLLSPKTSTKPAQMLMVNDESFAVVGTILLLIQMVTEYCTKADEINLAAQSLLRYVCDILREYNSRSYYLVLQAKAISNRTGLKKITCTNLVLSLRALQLLLWIMPFIQTHFSRFLDENQVSTIINRVKNDITKHIKDIQDKLHDIIKQIIMQQMSNWEAKPPIPSKSFQNICKHICKLHEAIASILPKTQIQYLYRQIHITFKEILHECINKMDNTNNDGPLRGIVSSELMFYIKSLESIDALPKDEMALQSMNDIWNENFSTNNANSRMANDHIM